MIGFLGLSFVRMKKYIAFGFRKPKFLYHDHLGGPSVLVCF